MGDSPSTPPTTVEYDSSDSQYENTVEPIAVIGIGCRFPGDASHTGKLWENLANGVSAWSKGPDGRFNMDAFHHPDNPYAGTTNTHGGHFLSEDVAAFDAAFFGINPNEAKAMDPQQRFMLEVAYEAFENAGITPKQLWSSNTGVYVGQWTSDYAEILSRDTDFPATYHTTGVGSAITSNRISYHFHLLGPSYTVDTGCSASLVALHAAVQSLRSKETDMSFVGGVNLLLDPQRFTYQSKLRMFSSDGRSYSFDERANGYGRGEGVTGVVLKPLATALRQGDRIRAIIRNCVLNQDGRTPGISVPSGAAQEKAIIKAYKDAGLEPSADYVEAHGTGTAVGDPIEVTAIASVLSKGSSSTSARLPIGSIKGNIGHTESAAGLAGLVKAVLMLERGAIPPQVNFQRVNEKILLDEWNLRIPTTLERSNLKRISVNSFGYGGTNAHVIVDSANFQTPLSTLLEPADASALSSSSAQYHSFIISGASQESCQLMLSSIARFVSETPRRTDENIWLGQLAYTLSRRTVYKHRALVAASNSAQLVERLQALSEKPIPLRQVLDNTRVAFVFSGQGAQYYNMGRELINAWPQFTASLQRANKHLAALGCTWDVFEELLKDEQNSHLDEPALGQPLSTTIQLALIDSILDLGIVPSRVAGHSSGEIAAAYCAGFLSFEDAIKASYHRGRLTSELLQRDPHLNGAMLAVGASAESVEVDIAALDPGVGKAKVVCYNSPSSVTVSGDREAIDSLSRLLEKKSVFNRILKTKGAAYHSAQMEKIEGDYYEALEGLSPSPGNPSIVMVSSLTGSEVKSSEVNRGYWVKNLVSPVLFEDAVWELCQDDLGRQNVEMIIEVGPHSQLEGPIKQITQSFQSDAKSIVYASVQKRKVNAEEAILDCLGHLFCENVMQDSHFHRANSGFQQALPSLLADLPPYAFDHGRTFWHESRLSKEYRHRQFRPHELLGNLSPDVNHLEPRWRRYLTLKELPWLEGHIVQGQIVFPAAGYLAMAIEAIRRHAKMNNPAAEIESFELRSITIGKAVVISDEIQDQEICLSLRADARSARNSWMDFKIFTVASNRDWVENCHGSVRANTIEASNQKDSSHIETVVNADDSRQVLHESHHHVSPAKFYQQAQDVGIHWRPPFSNVSALTLGPHTCFSRVKVPDLGKRYGSEHCEPEYPIHPSTLDACLFHGPFAIQVSELGFKSPFVPISIRNMRISARHLDKPGMEMSCYIDKKRDPLTFDVAVGTPSDSDGEESLVLRASGVVVSELPGDVSINSKSRELCTSVRWVTHCETMTSQRVDNLCKSRIPQDSATQQNRILEMVSLGYIRRALSEVSLEAVPEGHLRSQYGWMLSHTDDLFDETLIPIESSLSDFGVAGEALARVGPKLADILTGRIEPLAILNEGDLLSRIYSEGSCMRCYTQMAAYCKEMGLQNPGLRVVEIGAGTGSATEPLLQSLHSDEGDLISSWTFTDITPGFFQAAQDRLAEFSDVLKFQVLDAEKDVVLQGFEEGSYDLVVACNVVHATSNIGDTLDRIRSLLKPDGILMLMEISRERLYHTLSFGCLPGWWLGSGEGRESSPLLSESSWQDVLSSHGFAKSVTMLRDREDDNGGTMTTFVCKATGAKGAPVELPIELIVDGPHSEEAEEWISALGKQLEGYRVSHWTLHQPSNGGAISVVLPQVCDKLASGIEAEEWKGLKSQLLASAAVLLVTRGATGNCEEPLGAMVTGFARCFRLEHSDIRVITLDLDPDSSSEATWAAIATVLKGPSFDLDTPATQLENEFSERQGQLFVPRVFHEKALDNFIQDVLGVSEPEMATFTNNDRMLTAKLSIPGLLETLRWVDDITVPALGPDELELKLSAASINFKDVLIAAGQLQGITEMRNDCSGVVTQVGDNMARRFKVGDRVCGYYSRSYTNRPRIHGDCCAVIPDSMSFDEAASLPIVWATVYYSLVDKGNLSAGDSILIHSAAGAVGQAAIMLSQHIGADIFVTVGSEEKKQFLMERYNIPETHIFSSRTSAFGDRVRKMTKAGGADVILNSLSGEMFRESCNTIAPYGRFVEIGRKDFENDLAMPTRFLLKNITFAYVDLALLIEDRKPLVRRLLHDVIDLMTSGGIVRPTSITSMPISEIETAFRQIQAGKHIGKVILTVEDGQLAKIVPRSPPAARLRPNGVYLVVGGLGGLGKSIVRWLADHGAGQVVTLSRSGQQDDESLALVRDLKDQGVTVLTKKCDVGSKSSLQNVLTELQNSNILWPVRGVIQSAMVLKDATLSNMSYEEWTAAAAPKVAGSWNLHSLLPDSLDFFIMMSSVCAICGNPGQANYSAACSYQDALARFRCSKGLPAYSINVSVVIENGFVSENPQVAASLRRQGIGTISTAELLAQLNYAVTHPIAKDVVLSQSAIGLLPYGNEPGLGRGAWMSESRFRLLANIKTLSGSSSSSSSDIIQVIRAAESSEQARDLVCSAILEQLSKLIATPMERLSSSYSLDDLGVDSLVAVELRNWIGAYLHANIPMLTLRSTKNIDELATIVTKESRLVSKKA